MSKIPDFNLVRTLIEHGIPWKVSLPLDKTSLQGDLEDAGFDDALVHDLIDVLEAGMVLDLDWVFLDDHDREDVLNRISKHTSLDPQVVSEIMDAFKAAYEIGSDMDP